MMKAVVRYIDHKKGFECKEIPIPKVIPGYILIKMAASPINPIDEHVVTGDLSAYPIKFVEPICCGSEGSGIVTEIGEGVPLEYKGKKVVIERGIKMSLQSVGVWAEYSLMPYENCIIVDDSFNLEEICGLCINPIAAMGMIDLIKAEGCKAIVFTAASSSMGRIMIGLCNKEGIDMICLVRKKEHFEKLHALGAKYVLDTSDPTFETSLAELCKKLGPKICFDPIGGTLVGKIMNAMPPKATVYIYGALESMKLDGIGMMNLLLKDQSIKGYQMSRAEFFHDYTKLRKRFESVFEDIRKGGKTFLTSIAKKIKLEDCKEAMAVFKSVASQGKVVFIINP